MFFAEFVQLLHEFVLPQKPIKPYTKAILENSFRPTILGTLSDSYLYRAYIGKKNKKGAVIGDTICPLMRDISYAYDKGRFKEFILSKAEHLNCDEKIKLCKRLNAEGTEINPDNYAEIIATVLGEIYKEAAREPRSRKTISEKKEYDPKQLKAFLIEALNNDTDVCKAVQEITKPQIIDECKRVISEKQKNRQCMIKDINKWKFLRHPSGYDLYNTEYNPSLSLDSIPSTMEFHILKKS